MWRKGEDGEGNEGPRSYILIPIMLRVVCTIPSAILDGQPGKSQDEKMREDAIENYPHTGRRRSLMTDWHVSALGR